MRKLKKALSLPLALALTLALAVPAFAAPVQVDTHFSYANVTLSDVTSTSTATMHGTNRGDATLPLYVVPVGSSMDISGYDYLFIYKCSLGADGAYTAGDPVHDAQYSQTSTIVWDETYAGEIWNVSVWTIGGDGFLVKVEGTSTSTEPETPTEPGNPTEPEKPTAPAEVKTAIPTNDKLMVNGAEKAPTVYKIGGSNYFKIRDVAAVLNGTEKQFSVGYSDGKVTVTSSQPYEFTGKELKGAPSSDKDATRSNDTILINGTEASLTVYKIGGSNYFKLRDLGKALDFYVGYSDGNVTIDTSKSYS